MTKKKIAIAIAAAALAGTCAIGGTLAWLTANDSVKNTFTVGDVDLTVIETGDDGEDTPSGDRHYVIQPGVPFDKAPVVNVAETSVESFVFVTVTQTKDTRTGLYVEPGAMNESWLRVGQTIDGTGTKTTVYRYNGTVDPQNTDGDGVSLPLFTTATLSEKYTQPKEDESDAFTADIVVNGYAIQAGGFEAGDGLEAWQKAYDALATENGNLPARETLA